MKKIKKYTIVIVVVLAILILDQTVKLLMVNNQNEIDILQGILKLNYSENTGIAFGMASGNVVKVILTEILVLFILIRFLTRQIENINLMPKISLSFIIAGGLSNIIDRIIRGKVIDYIHISGVINEFPIFNIADIFIVVGFIIFATTVLIDLIKMYMKN